MTWPDQPTTFRDSYSYRVDEQLGGMGRPPPSTTGTLSLATEDARYTIRSTQVVDLAVAIVVEPKDGKPVEIPCVADVRGEVANIEEPVAFDPAR